MPTPLISAIMPAFNSHKYIREAIDSVLNQTEQNFELIIINDGSTDDTESIVQCYDSEKIRYYANSKNLGIANTNNRAIDLARGEFIALAEHDDISHPERFATQIDFMRKNPEIDVLGTEMIQLEGAKRKHIRNAKRQHHQQCLEILVHETPILNPTVMFRKTALQNIRYNPKYPYAEDLKLYTDLAKSGAKFANLTTPLADYRWHSANVSITKENEQRENAALIRSDYWAYFFKNINADMSALLNTDKILSLQELSTIYNGTPIDKKPLASRLIRKYIRANIKAIGFSFSPEISGLVCFYWLKYKIKCWFKKPPSIPKARDSA